MQSSFKLSNRLILIALLILIVYFPILYGLIVEWAQDSNYSHGFLVIPIALWLVWRQRSELAQIPIRSSRWGLPVIILALLILVVGTAGAEYFSVRISFVILLAGLTIYLAGWQIFRKTWFAFFFLLFMIPIPYIIYYSMTFPMQLFASKIAARFLGVIGLPLLRLGNVLYLSGGQVLEVAEACSGLRSIVSLLALGALFAYFTQPNKIKAIALFLSTIPIAILGNVFRISFTAIGTYSISEKFVEGTLHELAGLTVFAFSFIMLIIFGAILKWKLPERKS